MNPTNALLVIAGIFIIGRLVTKDSQGETLAGRLVGGQPQSSQHHHFARAAAAAPANRASTPPPPTRSAGSSRMSGGGLLNTHSTTFAKDVLQSLHAPATPANINSLMDWFQREGNPPTIDHFNPLDTTLGEPGAVSTNSVGVKSYRSWAQGVTATAQTLAGGGYLGDP